MNVQDTIRGESPQAEGSSDKSSVGNGSSEEVVEGMKKKKKHVELYDRLLKSFSQVQKHSRKMGHDNLAVVNVAPSVVPNPYLPSFRIFSYNVSGTRYRPEDRGVGSHQGDFEIGGRWDEGTFEKRGEGWNSSPNSPSRKNGLWTPLGYAQVRACDDVVVFF